MKCVSLIIAVCICIGLDVAQSAPADSNAAAKALSDSIIDMAARIHDQAAILIGLPIEKELTTPETTVTTPDTTTPEPTTTVSSTTEPPTTETTTTEPPTTETTTTEPPTTETTTTEPPTTETTTTEPPTTETTTTEPPTTETTTTEPPTTETTTTEPPTTETTTTEPPTTETTTTEPPTTETTTTEPPTTETTTTEPPTTETTTTEAPITTEDPDNCKKCPKHEIENPVCGVLEKAQQVIYLTFASRCELDRWNNCLHKDAAFELNNDGKCTEPNKCSEYCPTHPKPLCAIRSDAYGIQLHSFSNLCTYLYQVCSNPGNPFKKISDQDCQIRPLVLD